VYHAKASIRSCIVLRLQTLMTKTTPFQIDEATRSEIIEMALSDHTSFQDIKDLHGLSPDGVKALMRASLKPGSYRAWRKRVRDFGDRRAVYK
jgi:uncharacterized protein (TIGR03643 family)